jgi:hypothetical protein
MENTVIKVITLTAVGAAIVLLLKARQANAITVSVNGAPANKVPLCNLIPQQIQTRTCAIPLAASYLGQFPAHIPAVAPIHRLVPLKVSDCPSPGTCKILEPTVQPMGVKQPYNAPCNAIMVSGLCCKPCCACSATNCNVIGATHCNAYFCECINGHEIHCNSEGGCGPKAQVIWGSCNDPNVQCATPWG